MDGERDWLIIGFQSLIMEETELEILIISFQSLIMDKTEGERDWLIIGFKASSWKRQTRDWLSVFKVLLWTRQMEKATVWLVVFKASSWRRQNKDTDRLSYSKASSWTRQQEKETDYWFLKPQHPRRLYPQKKRGVKHSPHTTRWETKAYLENITEALIPPQACAEGSGAVGLHGIGVGLLHTVRGQVHTQQLHPQFHIVGLLHLGTKHTLCTHAHCYFHGNS